MRIGISVSSSHRVEHPRDGARNMVERARAARLTGLESLFIGDHHVTPFPYYQNTAVLGRMLAEWGSEPFGALYLLPLWHPVILAEQVATLATLPTGADEPGRFILQCGLGDHRQGKALGIDMTQRVSMFEASLELLRALWNGETVSEQRFWGITEACVAPQPAEPIDVWIGAVVPAAIERTARMGDGWLASPGLTTDEAGRDADYYRDACARHGRDPGVIGIRRDMLIADTAEAAATLAAPYVEGGYRGIDPSALLVGSPQQAAEHLAGLRAQGYTDVIVRNIASDQNVALASIEHLAEVRRLLDAE